MESITPSIQNVLDLYDYDADFDDEDEVIEYKNKAVASVSNECNIQIILALWCTICAEAFAMGITINNAKALLVLKQGIFEQLMRKELAINGRLHPLTADYDFESMRKEWVNAAVETFQHKFPKIPNPNEVAPVNGKHATFVAFFSIFNNLLQHEMSQKNINFQIHVMWLNNNNVNIAQILKNNEVYRSPAFGHLNNLLSFVQQLFFYQEYLAYWRMDRYLSGPRLSSRYYDFVVNMIIDDRTVHGSGITAYWWYMSLPSTSKDIEVAYDEFCQEEYFKFDDNGTTIDLGQSIGVSTFMLGKNNFHQFLKVYEGVTYFDPNQHMDPLRPYFSYAGVPNVQFNAPKNLAPPVYQLFKAAAYAQSPQAYKDAVDQIGNEILRAQ